MEQAELRRRSWRDCCENVWTRLDLDVLETSGRRWTLSSERQDLAAARVVAAGVRAEQLRVRVARLRAGETSTPADVELAKAFAAEQRAEAERAQQRLLRAYAAAAALGSSRSARSGATAPRDAAADDGLARTPETENSILRRALVSIASSSDTSGGWPADRRRELWEALIDQCGQQSWNGWCDALCSITASTVPGLRGVAVSGYDNRAEPHLLGVTDSWTRQMEEIGQLAGEGPGIEAHRVQSPVLVQDLADEQARWPGFVAAAATHSGCLNTVYAFPVRLNGVGLASLTFYPRDQGGGGWPAWRDGFYLATVAAKAVLADLDAIEHGWPTGDVGDDRVLIATGRLAAQLAVSVDEASALLRAFAFGNARGLGEVAQEVLDGVLRIT